MADTTTIAGEDVGVFARDQIEILATRKGEPGWLREQRLQAHEAFASTPMPTTQPEEWRYTPIAEILKLDTLEPAEEAKPVTALTELPEGLRALIEDTGDSAGRLVQLDASAVLRELDEGLRAQEVIFTSLEAAVREHPELVQKHLGTAVTTQDGKFAAMNAALWTGGTFLHVPAGVRVELPLRSFRWATGEGSASFGRTLVVAEDGAEVTLVDELGSRDASAQTLSVGAAEVFADEGARVNYVAVQRWGRGTVHLTTDRLIAGRDARITTLYVALGGDVTRADVQCRLVRPGAHVDMLGLYLPEGNQHFDHQTLQDHISPHASSNLLFKGALRDQARSVFRGLIRVHPGAQRTDAYQTNRNLILSSEARADSLPNLEIAADDVRCSHAATVGQLDEEEIFYLLSRGIPMREAIRLVVFGFFGEVLDQFPNREVKQELVRAIERKLAVRQA
ncbi:Fe-S cluster assembly protein SufD [soil metagenome]